MQSLVADRERASACEAAFAMFHKFEHGVLHHFGVHLEWRNLVVFTETGKHGVCHVAHTTLHREEFLGNTSGAEFVSEEIAHIGTDAHSNLVGRRERSHMAGVGAFNHTDNLFGVDFEHHLTDSITWLVDRDFAAIRRVERHIHIVEATQFGVDCGVMLQDYDVSHSDDSGSDTETCAEHNLAIVVVVSDLKNGNIEFAEEAVTHFLGEFGKVSIGIVSLMAVESGTHILARLIGSAEVHRFSTCQSTINEIVGRSTGEHTDFERTSRSMFTLSQFGNSRWHHLGSSRCSKARESYIVTIFHIFGCLLSRDNWE